MTITRNNSHFIPEPIIGIYALSRFTESQSGYGIHSLESSIAVLEYAWSKGCRIVDTAPGYGGGESDKLIAMLSRNSFNFSVNTKLGLDIKTGTFISDPYALLDQCKQVIKIHGDSLNTVLLHSPPFALLANKSDLTLLLDRLRGILPSQVTCGISIATPAHLPLILDLRLEQPLHIQTNYSLLDKRALSYLNHERIGNFILSARSLYGSGLLPLIFKIPSQDLLSTIKFHPTDIRSDWDLESLFAKAKNEIEALFKLKSSYPDASLSQLIMDDLLGSIFSSYVLGPQSVDDLQDTLSLVKKSSQPSVSC